MPGNIDEKKLLDKAAQLAFLAKKGRVNTAQVNKLLEVLNSVGDDKTSLLYLAAFAMRQAGKGQLSRDFARKLKEELLILYRSAENSRNAARTLLGSMKWLFESIEKERINFSAKVETFEDFMGLLR